MLGSIAWPSLIANTPQTFTAAVSHPGPDLYFYEVVECGRRMLLTGVLIFIAPQSPTQTSMACIFAFASLLGFELMRPHLDPADSWLYRMVSRGSLSILVLWDCCSGERVCSS